MRLDRIKIVEYDAAWAGKFEQQRARIEPLLAGWLAASIEHIGSTSVPGLPAKPIIDMVAVVDDYDACAESFGPLATLGWLVAPEPGEVEARKWSLCYPSIERRTHHLHIFEASSDALQTLLAFRDHLRSSPEDRAAYAQLKRDLAAADDEDRPAYRAGKAPFITAVMARLGG